MSEQVCLKEKIDHVKFWVEYFEKKIERHTQIDADKRGHKNNERVRKWEVRRDHFKEYLRWLEFNENETDHYHIDVIKPVEVAPLTEQSEPRKDDSEYLI